MEPRRREVTSKHQQLLQKRMELHGHRRQLHDRLTEVCEEFALGDLSRRYKHNTLISELEYLLGYYKDEENWEGIE